MPATESKKEPAKRPHKQVVDAKLLELLVCPVTHKPLRYDRKRQELISETAGLAFPIRDGIPIMLEDEARIIEDR
ncbi:MAG: Trm112 family protein [Alphaproteobacteria bacterium]|nr:Trm112 family protein [Alphaproteobacteria bacterium]